MAARERTIEEMYQKKTQLEHILLRPDAYIGSVEAHTQHLWVYEGGSLVQRDVTYVPGLYKIFDEILVNAADHKSRCPGMDLLRVNINADTNTLQVWNNGDGIPVEIHTGEGVYLPEMIFSHLLTGSNYDDEEIKTTGGRNGYGAKLANIFSTEFVIETADGKRQRKYKQVFSQNMSEKSQPLIGKCRENEAWTSITFKPDLAKFHMTHLEDDVVALMRKRVMDIAGCLGKGIKVELDGQRVPVKGFSDYVSLYLSASSSSIREEPLPSGALRQFLLVTKIEPHRGRIYEHVNDRWEVCVSLSEGQFQQVSFVNSIATMKGGTHVAYITDQIVTNLLLHINKKKEVKGNPIKPFQVKNHLWVFVNSVIENPAFDSQTKEMLTTRQSALGSTCTLSPKFMTQVAKCGIVEHLLTWATYRASKDLKKNDGSKRTQLKGIAKLDDANEAGGRNSELCTLILTEGDSAKTLAMSGLSVVGRDRYGVFPLKGKLLNVRDASHKQIMENVEITNIKQILGLQHGKQYDSVKTLRYGHLMIMTDQDHDGSHIKGLLINFIHSFWPSLLAIPSFMVEFITPIVKASKGKESLSFFTIPEYEKWKESHGGRKPKGWSIKYYKGLGTSRREEAIEYFKALDQHKKDFEWTNDHEGSYIEMAFAKKKVDERKTWLRNFEPGTYLDQSTPTISYQDFVNKELILFSLADNMRSIPSVMDGLKPGQRKILYACFKRNLTKECRVASLAGYVTEHTAYHHGEASLNSTITGLAQDFVGSNNINLLFPSGGFGSRAQGGKDAASPRYTHTYLCKITRAIFPEADDCLLYYLNDDGLAIEPVWYLPIIPMVLVNGSEGIGTGWSSFVPNYNPRELIANLKSMIQGGHVKTMDPWYKGFQGSIQLAATKENGQSYTVTGTIQQTSATTVDITELPVRRWTQDYKEFLESLMETSDKQREPFIKSFSQHHFDTTVHFVVELSEANMALALAEGLEKKFKLTSTISTTNMHLFDKDGRITKYDSPEQSEPHPLLSCPSTAYTCIYCQCSTTLDWNITTNERQVDIDSNLYFDYAFQLSQLKEDLIRLDNRTRFILAVVQGTLIVSNRRKADLLAQLQAAGFAPLSTGKSKRVMQAGDVDAEEDQDGDEDMAQPSASASGVAVGYDYLLSMPLWSLTLEKVEELCKERDAKEEEMHALAKVQPKNMWDRELDQLLVALEAKEEEEEAQIKESQQGFKAQPKAGKVQKKTQLNSHRENKENVIPTGRNMKDAYASKKPAATSKPILAKALGKPTSASIPKPTGNHQPSAPLRQQPLADNVEVASDGDEDFGLSLDERLAAMAKQRTQPAIAPGMAMIWHAADSVTQRLVDDKVGKESAKADIVLQQRPPSPKISIGLPLAARSKARRAEADSEDESEKVGMIDLDDESGSDYEVQPKKKKASSKKAGRAPAKENPAVTKSSRATGVAAKGVLKTVSATEDKNDLVKLAAGLSDMGIAKLLPDQTRNREIDMMVEVQVPGNDIRPSRPVRASRATTKRYVIDSSSGEEDGNAASEGDDVYDDASSQ
eukprot:SM000034S12767  [mRNA]  locus=s34:580239:590114:+ [translate_table: standard]